MIRPVAEGDLPQLLDLVEGLVRHHGDRPGATLATLQRDFLDEPRWFHGLVAGEGSLAGYAALLPRARLGFGQRGMDLHHLYVAEGFRGRGIGAALVRASLDLARGLGCDYLIVGAHPDNAAAQGYYRKLGFAQDGGDGGVRFFKLL